MSIPALGIDHIKAKVDTGARSSALHTFDLETYAVESGENRVRFRIHPLPGDSATEVACDWPVHATRSVRDSGGHEQERPFILVPLVLGDYTWDVEVSLTNRDNMKFRMLLGRSAIAGRFVVDPENSYLIGKRYAVPSRPGPE